MEILISVFIFIIGTFFGSFYACMGYRIPNKIGVCNPPSFCNNCKNKLKWWMNIPIFSYVFLKGKCYYCKEKISIDSFLIEIFSGLSFLVSYILFGFSMEFYIILILTSAFFVTAVSDFKFLYVSDRVIVISLILELIVYLNYFTLKEVVPYFIGMISMFLMLLTLKLIADKILKRESIGGGDIKLMLLVGFTLGFINSLVSLFIASIMTLIFHFLIEKNNKSKEIPFGPFIILGIIITYILIYYGFKVI